ncbi:HNH endonuclease [Clostridium gasigenes]|uniref:HNH endonuclease n=1 Tax=Clostridium gasigenes TaxID=94869 RepID=UPI001C0CEC56|nr:HNH endonuclease [Clostridium gasigenes]MBU3102566.1 HNH endonuclease [Clostridium gasigenes]
MSTDRIEVHHIKYIITHPELSYEIGNTTNLCQICHKDIHRLYKNGELDYAFKPLEYKYTL